MHATRPAPAYVTDSSVMALRTAELLVVSSLRLWVAACKNPAARHPDWRDGFTHAGIDDEAVPAFDGLLTLIATAATRSLDVRCAHCRRLGADEAWLMQLVCTLQHRQTAKAAAILADFLPPAAVHAALPLAQDIAQSMETARLCIPDRHLHAIAGLALVH